MKESPESASPVFFDDGTLGSKEASNLLRVFPRATIHSRVHISRRLESRFPKDEFPLIWYYRAHKPIIRKLTDVFGFDDEWRLLLDSDMLFFLRPAELIDWLRNPDTPCYMRDVTSAYGYSRPLMEDLTGATLAECVNIGVFGFSARFVDWKRCERWLRNLTESEGLKYNLTQALCAMLIAGKPARCLQHDRYIVQPDENEVERPTGILHHYVSASKTSYFRTAWRHFCQD